jgi:hypothetical protein
MLFSLRWRRERPGDNRLVPVVRPFDHRTRQALYAAANGGLLARRTWDGCALDRAALELGRTVKTKGQAVETFGAPPHVIANFLRVWDRLGGSDERCTALLRDALLAVGLFPETEPAPVRAAPVPAPPAPRVGVGAV